MVVELNQTPQTNQTFGDLNSGDTFFAVDEDTGVIYTDYLLMKLDNHCTVNGETYNAVELTYGDFERLGDDEKILVPRMCKVVVDL